MTQRKNFPLRAFRVLKSFGRPPQTTINRLQIAQRKKRIKVTLAPIAGAKEKGPAQP